jgi:AcrR family transcriptional regulator
LNKTKFSLKKQPVQQRSVFMVDSIKEAATRILKEQGVEGFNTNAVAEKAGVSIGSLYQYFGSKEALIAEIKREHFSQLRLLLKQAQESLQTDMLSELVDAFVNASVKGHLIDPDLHRVLSQDLGSFEIKEKDDSDDSILVKGKQALAAYKNQLRHNLDIDAAAEIVYYLVEKTVHDTILNERDPAKQTEVINELKILVMTYLSASMSE